MTNASDDSHNAASGMSTLDLARELERPHAEVMSCVGATLGLTPQEFRRRAVKRLDTVTHITRDILDLTADELSAVRQALKRRKAPVPVRIPIETGIGSRQAPSKSITSREIAALTNRSHQDVMQSLTTGLVCLDEHNSCAYLEDEETGRATFDAEGRHHLPSLRPLIYRLPVALGVEIVSSSIDFSPEQASAVRRYCAELDNRREMPRTGVTVGNLNGVERVQFDVGPPPEPETEGLILVNPTAVMQATIVSTGPGEPVKTMSSLEIAELTGKQHAHVMRDIKTVLEQAKIDASKFGGVYLGGNGQQRPCYHLPRLECDLVVSGYSVPYRLAIIKRWHELEAKEASAPVALPTYPEALRQLAAAVEQNAAQAHQLQVKSMELAEQAPKVEAYHRLQDSDGLHGVGEAAKLLRLSLDGKTIIGEINFFKLLRADGILLSARDMWNLPAHWAIKRGYLEAKVETWVNPKNGREHTTTVSKVTPKGLTWLARYYSVYILPEEGV